MWCQNLLILITFPCGCFQFCFFSRSACWNLSEVTSLVLCNKFVRRIKLPSADVDVVHYLFLSIFLAHLQQYLHDPTDPLKHCIFYIDLHAVYVLVSHGEILSPPYFQGGFFLDEKNPSYFCKKLFVALLTDWFSQT